MAKKIMEHAEWHALGTKKFGEDIRQWRLKCPKCGAVHRVQDWFDAKQLPAGHKCLDCGFADPGNLPILVKSPISTEGPAEVFAFEGQVILGLGTGKGLGLF